MAWMVTLETDNSKLVAYFDEGDYKNANALHEAFVRAENFKRAETKRE